ncbi:PilZ domain-containing protein [Sphingomonas hankyongi]|uniref:PilZ domain-containing protein n=1 Tax=Sphingomonas hankyongi TaxID=2908209 RepID=UPI003D33A444
MERMAGWIDRPDRDPVSVAASLVIAGRQLMAEITNVSDDGCQIACEENLPIGAAVSLRLELVSIAATVRWSLPGKAGLRFRK